MVKANLNTIVAGLVSLFGVMLLFVIGPNLASPIGTATSGVNSTEFGAGGTALLQLTPIVFAGILILGGLVLGFKSLT